MPHTEPHAHRGFILCADDYGMSPGVSDAIRHLVARRRLNATSVMVTSPGLTRAEADALMAVATPERCAIGLHFTLTAPFGPASRSYRPLKDDVFLSLPRTLAAGLLRRLDPASLAAEAASQFAAFRNLFGRPPDFVDGHQHVQLLPQVSDALLGIMAKEAPGAWIRQCGRAPGATPRRDPKGRLLDVLSRRLRARSAACGIATNPAFAGTYDFRRRPDYVALFGAFLDCLPSGGVVMCHPGFVDAQLRRLDDLTAAREQEYAFFAGEHFPQLLARQGVRLV